MRISDWSSDVALPIYAPALGERLHRLDIILIRIVDREIGAERARGVAFVRAAAGDGDPDAEHPAQADSGGADAAGAAVDEHRLALAHPGAFEQIVPDGEQDRKSVV